MSAEIVIADDDETIRELVTFKLERAGHAVTAFETGRDCWEYLSGLESDAPDLAVLDVMMPGLSGIQVLERIRDDDAIADLPVIVLTSRGREEHVVEGIQKGATDYMTKPFSPSELVARVDSRIR